FEPDPDPWNWESPVVRVIQDASGADLDPVPVVNLAEDPDRSVASVRAPEELGINVSGYLYRDVDTGSKAEPPVAG
ncbi:MAG: hypothetical protein ACYTAF_15325, partial [Planctomycetota bacterium]